MIASLDPDRHRGGVATIVFARTVLKIKESGEPIHKMTLQAGLLVILCLYLNVV